MWTEELLRRDLLERTRDGSTEEIASWTMEAQRLSQEVEAKREKTPRGDRERIHDERRQDVGRRFGWMALCRREGANADIASSIRMETPCGVERIRECKML